MTRSIGWRVAPLAAVLGFAPMSFCCDAWAQDCNPYSISLTTQSEVDEFQAAHGPCTRVAGRLSIGGAEITNLGGLAELLEIQGGLNVHYTELLTNLDGLENLEQLNTSLYLDSNTLLEEVDALAGATGQLEKLVVYENRALASLNGLSGLTDITETIWIQTNPELTSLDGLPQITELSGSLRLEHYGWQFEPSTLSDLAGLEQLQNVGGVLWITHLAIRNVNELANIRSVGGSLRIESNFNLETVNTLNRLETVGHISIRGNEKLGSINGFMNLREVTGTLEISGNPLWSQFSGFPALESVGAMLYINRNDGWREFDGFNALTSSGGIQFSSNFELIELDGFDKLSQVSGEIAVSSNHELQRIPAFSSLSSVGDDVWITSNYELLDISGISMLEKVGGSLQIRNNGLRDLESFGGVKQVGQDLVIRDNINLDNCDAIIRLVDPIDDADPGPGTVPAPDVGGYVELRNLPGCNSVAELLSKVPLYTINSGLSDAWFNHATSGQGFLITVFPDIEQIFMAWFTYDTERPSEDITAILGEPGHRWLTAQGDFIDNVAELTLYVSAGGVFDAEEPKPETLPYGEILLEFSTCNAGTVNYDIPSIFQVGSISIERIALDNVPLCYVLEKQAQESDPVDE